MRNLHCRFVLCSNGQIYVRDFAKFCGLLRIYELYLIHYFYNGVKANFKSHLLCSCVKLETKKYIFVPLIFFTKHIMTATQQTGQFGEPKYLITIKHKEPI